MYIISLLFLWNMINVLSSIYGKLKYIEFQLKLERNALQCICNYTFVIKLQFSTYKNIKCDMYAYII